MLIPEYQTHYDTVASLITAFCDQHLDTDYKAICFHALENSDIIDAEVKRCSFCGKPLSKVRRMIAGSASLICSECVELCKEILDESDPPVDIHMPLNNLGFTRRTLIALENAGYTEVGQMMELTENQMRNLPGIGNVAANNIIATLKTVGVYLK